MNEIFMHGGNSAVVIDSPNKTIMSGGTSALVGNTVMFQEKKHRIAELAHFFNQLFGKITAPHFAYLWTKQRGIFPFVINNESQRMAMAIKAVELSSIGVDVWHSVNTVSVQPSNGKRGDETVVSYQTAIVTDIDIIGAAHKSTNLAANFDEAKSFLPIKTSILLDSGHGAQAYYIFNQPILVTEQNREELKRRNNLWLDFIRQCANGKDIDGVGDLPRVMRTPGTFNYKLGKEHAPMCHIVEDSGLRFSPDQIDEKLKAVIQIQAPKTQTTSTAPTKSKKDFANDSDFNIFRIRRMLDFISPSNLTYDEWLAVGMALKNIGCNYSDWEQWSRADERFKDGECESKWNGFNRDGYGIGTLCMFAQQGGYDAKETYREWYKLYPNLRPSAKRNMNAATKRELDDAFILLETLEPEKFSADDAYAPVILHAVALATAYGFPALAKKFFDTIKAAQKLAKIRIADSKNRCS